MSEAVILISHIEHLFKICLFFRIIFSEKNMQVMGYAEKPSAEQLAFAVAGSS
jgi:hypothetical protein